MGTAPRSSAAPLHSFRIHVFICAESCRNALPAPKHWKNKQIWWFWALSEFSEFSVFSVFFLFLFRFFVFWGVSNFRIFRFFGWARFRGNRPPAQGFFFVFLAPVPSQTQNHSPKTATCRGNAAMQLIAAAGSPPSFPSMPTQMCCVSAQRPKESS